MKNGDITYKFEIKNNIIQATVTKPSGTESYFANFTQDPNDTVWYGGKFDVERKYVKDAYIVHCNDQTFDNLKNKFNQSV